MVHHSSARYAAQYIAWCLAWGPGPEDQELSDCLPGRAEDLNSSPVYSPLLPSAGARVVYDLLMVTIVMVMMIMLLLLPVERWGPFFFFFFSLSHRDSCLHPLPAAPPRRSPFCLALVLCTFVCAPRMSRVGVRWVGSLVTMVAGKRKTEERRRTWMDAWLAHGPIRPFWFSAALSSVAMELGTREVHAGFMAGLGLGSRGLECEGGLAGRETVWVVRGALAC